MTNNIVSTKDIWKWVGLGWVGVQHVVGWVGFVLWWVGLGFKKLTHVHVCVIQVRRSAQFYCFEAQSSCLEFNSVTDRQPV